MISWLVLSLSLLDYHLCLKATKSKSIIHSGATMNEIILFYNKKNSISHRLNSKSITNREIENKVKELKESNLDKTGVFFSKIRTQNLISDYCQDEIADQVYYDEGYSFQQAGNTVKLWQRHGKEETFYLQPNKLYHLQCGILSEVTSAKVSVSRYSIHKKFKTDYQIEFDLKKL